MKKYAKAANIIFCILLGIFCLLGFCLFLRPSVSEVEKRELAKFPEFTFQSFCDGSYFSDISAWYADTYPGREFLISADQTMKMAYGIKTESQVVGTVKKADDIPDFEALLSEDNSDSFNSDPGTDVPLAENNREDTKEEGELLSEEKTKDSAKEDEASMKENSESDNPLDEGTKDEGLFTEGDSELQTLEEETEGKNEQDTLEEQVTSTDSDILLAASDENANIEPPTATAMEAEIKQFVHGSLYVKDGAAYTIYYFGMKSATRYIDLLNNTAEKLAGICNVYSILEPNQSGIVLSDEEQLSLGGSNQSDAIKYYYSQYENVTGIDTVDILKEHRDEYLFYRTDHHGTALSGYYIYKSFCKAKKYDAHPLSFYEEKIFEPFLGSYYSNLKDPEMEANPDYVVAYVPKATNDMVYTDKAGVEHKWNVIEDVSNWNKFALYSCFIAGDEPLVHIHNPLMHDNSAVLVIKESYANRFVPFLVDHYQDVYVMDYRYTSKNIIEFINEKHVDDLIMYNNISTIGAGGVISKLESLLQ